VDFFLDNGDRFPWTRTIGELTTTTTGWPQAPHSLPAVTYKLPDGLPAGTALWLHVIMPLVILGTYHLPICVETTMDGHASRGFPYPPTTPTTTCLPTHHFKPSPRTTTVARQLPHSPPFHCILRLNQPALLLRIPFTCPPPVGVVTPVPRTTSAGGCPYGTADLRYRLALDIYHQRRPQVCSSFVAGRMGYRTPTCPHLPFCW